MRDGISTGGRTPPHFTDQATDDSMIWLCNSTSFRWSFPMERESLAGANTKVSAWQQTLIYSVTADIYVGLTGSVMITFDQSDCAEIKSDQFGSTEITPDHSFTTVKLLSIL